MKINIPTYEFEKVLKSENIVEFPDETTYWFETGIRRSIKLEPEWTMWNMKNGGEPEYIWRYIVTEVMLSSECIVKKHSIPTSDIINFERLTKGSDTRSIIDSFINGWFDPRRKEQFDTDLETAIKEIRK